jgi:uncharacterized coiled-coil protein SlyX
MLIALGFLSALLLVLLAAPAFWSRAVRLTTRRLQQTLPLSQMEVEAGHDRIRAEYAIKMHKLERLVEQVKLAAAHQQIEINRRDAQINSLEADLERLRTAGEEAQNARRVLEQTVTQRLPRVERQLADARKLLKAREEAIADLQRSAAERQAVTPAVDARDPAGAQVETENESSLRAELESLRATAREQAGEIERLSSLSLHPEAAAAGPTSGDLARADLERRLEGHLIRSQQQAGEIERLQAALAAAETAQRKAGGEAPARGTPLGERMQSFETQSTEQADTIQKLQDELAAANERLARQAEHFTGELRRIGSAATPAGASRPRPAGAQTPRQSLAERVALAQSAADEIEGEVGKPEPKAGRARSDRAESTDQADADAGDPAKPRPRLLERIAGLGRPT